MGTTTYRGRPGANPQATEVLVFVADELWSEKTDYKKVFEATQPEARGVVINKIHLPRGDHETIDAINHELGNARKKGGVGAVIWVSHGSDGQLYLGSNQEAGVPVEQFLHNVSDQSRGKKIAGAYYFFGCDVLGNADAPRHANLMESSRQLGSAPIIVGSSVMVMDILHSKMSGDAYKITPNAITHFSPWSGESENKSAGVGSSAALGYDNRATQAAADLAKYTQSGQRLSAEGMIRVDEYSHASSYAQAKVWLDQHPNDRSDMAQTYAKTVLEEIPKLDSVYRPEAWLRVISHTPTGSPEQIDMMGKMFVSIGQDFQRDEQYVPGQLNKNFLHEAFAYDVARAAVGTMRQPDELIGSQNNIKLAIQGADHLSAGMMKYLQNKDKNVDAYTIHAIDE